MKKANEDETVYRTSLSLYTWPEHQEPDCTICEMAAARKVGGRPKKKKNIPACPNYLTDHVRSVAGPMSTLPLTTDRFIYNEADSEAVCVQDFVCGFCQNIIDEPIELPCKHSTCCVCILETLKQNVNTFPCPKCQRELQLTISSFQEPPPVAISVYGSW